MKLFKFRRIFAIICVIVLLFIFFSIPASCFTVASDPSYLFDPKFVSAPVPISFKSSGIIGRYDESIPFESFDTFSFNYSLADEDFLGGFTDSNFNRSGLIGSNSEWQYSSDSDETIYVGIGFESMTEESVTGVDFDPFELHTFYNDSNTYEDIIGVTNTYLHGFSHPSPATYTFDSFSVYLSDFYVWNYSFDPDIKEQFSEISLVFYNSAYTGFAETVVPSSIILNYSYFGQSDVFTYEYVLPEDAFDGDDLFVLDFSPDFMSFSSYEDYLIYIHDCEIFFDLTYENVDIVPELSVIYCFNPYLDNFDGFDYDNPSLSLTPFTKWLGTAASGFLDFPIYKGFTLGGIFMTIVAFTCCVWFLKLVAGG